MSAVSRMPRCASSRWGTAPAKGDAMTMAALGAGYKEQLPHRNGTHHQARDGRLLRPFHGPGDISRLLHQRPRHRFRRAGAEDERPDGQVPQFSRKPHIQQEPQPLRHLPCEERHRARKLLHSRGGLYGRDADASDGHRECRGFVGYLPDGRPDKAHQPFHEEHYRHLRRRFGRYQGVAPRYRHDTARGVERAGGAAARRRRPRFVRPFAFGRGGQGLHRGARRGFHSFQDTPADGRRQGTTR